MNLVHMVYEILDFNSGVHSDAVFIPVLWNMVEFGTYVRYWTSIQVSTMMLYLFLDFVSYLCRLEPANSRRSLQLSRQEYGA